MNYYTAIIFCVNDCGQSFTLSREVDTDELSFIYPFMKKEAKVSDEEVDTILLVKNRSGNDGPEVFKHWRAEGGDFEGL